MGAGQTYTTLSAAVAAASPGDVIDVLAGTYVDQSAIINLPLTIQGIGGTPIFSATTDLANGKGFLVIKASTTIDNIEFTGATDPDGNGAGIRYQGGNLVRAEQPLRRQPGRHPRHAVGQRHRHRAGDGSVFQDNGVADGPFSGFAMRSTAATCRR